MQYLGAITFVTSQASVLITGNGRVPLEIAFSFFVTENVKCMKCFSKYSPDFRGYFMEARDCPGATLKNSTIKDPDIVCCILDSAIIPSIPQNISVSLESYLDMVGDATRTRALYPFYLQALSDAGIWRRREIAAFTAQVSLKRSVIY